MNVPNKPAQPATPMQGPSKPPRFPVNGIGPFPDRIERTIEIVAGAKPETRMETDVSALVWATYTNSAPPQEAATFALEDRIHDMALEIRHVSDGWLSDNPADNEKSRKHRQERWTERALSLPIAIAMKEAFVYCVMEGSDYQTTQDDTERNRIALRLASSIVNSNILGKTERRTRLITRLRNTPVDMEREIESFSELFQSKHKGELRAAGRGMEWIMSNRAMSMVRIASLDKQGKEHICEEILRRFGKSLSESELLEFKRTFGLMLSISGIAYKPLFEIEPGILPPLSIGRGVNVPVELFERGAREGLDAHGVSQDRGGLHTLANIILEGCIRKGCVGMLKRGNPEYDAGEHGPFFVIVERNVGYGAGEISDQRSGITIPESGHIAYLVPDDVCSDGIAKMLKDGFNKGLLMFNEAVERLSRVVAYSEFLSAPPHSFMKYSGYENTKRESAIAKLATGTK